MTGRDSASSDITPEMLLRAYACGIFPMADSADDPGLHWIEPPMRGIIPLEGFHISSRLARTVRSDRFTVRVDCDFDGVLDGCAAPQPGRLQSGATATCNGRPGGCRFRADPVGPAPVGPARCIGPSPQL